MLGYIVKYAVFEKVNSLQERHEYTGSVRDKVRSTIVEEGELYVVDYYMVVRPENGKVDMILPENVIEFK